MAESKLSLFVGFAEPFSSDLFSKSHSSKSPKSFDDRAVGLGIVAAMIDSAGAMARSDPVPIFSPRVAANLGKPIWKEEEMDLYESYTCVISHVGGNSLRKRVYYDDGFDDIGGGPAVFFECAPPVKLALPIMAKDFLSCCFLCKKKLHGLDIFMYRGDKAFCSVECRCQHILSEDHGDKCGSEAMKSLDMAVSPCSAPLFSAGIAAA